MPRWAVPMLPLCYPFCPAYLARPSAPPSFLKQAAGESLESATYSGYRANRRGA